MLKEVFMRESYVKSKTEFIKVLLHSPFCDDMISAVQKRFQVGDSRVQIQEHILIRGKSFCMNMESAERPFFRAAQLSLSI